MIPLEEARDYVLSLVAPGDPVQVAVRDALGLVLAESVRAQEPVPPFANTAMDGFALRAEETGEGAVFEIVGTVAAGSTFAGVVEPGQAVRIMTGAPIPAGADAVVMVEHASVSEDGATVRIDTEVPAGNHIRPAGDDMQPGDEAVGPGATVDAGVVGVLATLGRSEVRVHPRPRVGVMSTGDELVEGPGPLQPGQIRDSNRATLLAMLAESGCSGVDLGLIRDDATAITEALTDAAASCDLVVTSGGVSMGDFDLVKVVLDRLGEMRWMQVAIRPAKPLAAGRIGATPVIGLPGNPVSSMVSFELFARPALRKMAGHAQLDRPRIAAVVEGEPLRRRPDGKVHFARVRLRQQPDLSWTARSAGGQGSHHTAAMAAADGLAVLEDGPGAEVGDTVAVIPLC